MNQIASNSAPRATFGMRLKAMLIDWLFFGMLFGSSNYILSPLWIELELDVTLYNFLGFYGFSEAYLDAICIWLNFTFILLVVIPLFERRASVGQRLWELEAQTEGRLAARKRLWFHNFVRWSIVTSFAGISIFVQSFQLFMLLSMFGFILDLIVLAIPGNRSLIDRICGLQIHNNPRVVKKKLMPMDEPRIVTTSLDPFSTVYESVGVVMPGDRPDDISDEELERMAMSTSMDDDFDDKSLAEFINEDDTPTSA